MRGVLVACVLLAGGCYTDHRGGTNLCIPGHDGLCPAPTVLHRVAPTAVLTAGEPVVLAQTYDDLSTSYSIRHEDVALEEIAVDSGKRAELPFDDLVLLRDGLDNKAISVVCTTFCAAAWINDEGVVVTAIREASGWSSPHVHDGKTSLPMVAIFGDGALVAWMQNDAGYGDFQVRQLDRAGNVLASSVVVTHVSTNAATLTAGPTGYLATWHREQMTSDFIPDRYLVAQMLGIDGMPLDASFEVSLGATSGVIKDEQWPTAFFDGAFHVVDDDLPGNAMWAVIDPTARTIQFSGPTNVAINVKSITPKNPGAFVSIGAYGSTTGILGFENEMIVSNLDLASAPAVGATPGGYVLAYRNAAFRDNAELVVEKRDAALQLIEAPRTIAEDYDLGNGCAAGHGAHGASTIVLLALALSRAARRRPRSRR